MLITKTPFRISFCGGGSDLPAFYRQEGGCVLSTSINKYMYISIHPYFEDDRISLKYSENENVTDIDAIRHSIFHKVLNQLPTYGVEIVSTADVPSGTGLGSSSSFTVGLLHSLYSYHGKFVSKARLAEEACAVEIEKLHSPIGKQDQYAAAFGGLNFIEFHMDDTVSVNPVILDSSTSQCLQDNLVLFYTGLTHDANKILAEQNANMEHRDKRQNLRKMCLIARQMKEVLQTGDLSSFGRLLDESWKLKRCLATNITVSEIDNLYDVALRNGAEGGKLLGAGGGGFLLFYCVKDKQPGLASALGLKEMPFRFERDGTSVIYIGDKYW